MANPNTYNKEWFTGQQKGAHSSAKIIVPIVIDLVFPNSVIDVGSGVGAWLACFQKNGVNDILGIDGNWVHESQLLISRQFFQKRDIAKPFTIGRTFDLAVCLEVGEHLPEESAKDLVKTLVTAAPVVLFSAAIPKQGGTDHINEQWPDYWANLFKTCNYVSIDAIRRRVWTNPNVEYWYAQNTIIYVKESEMHRYPKLEEEVRCGYSVILPLVHPRKYFYALQPPPSIWFRIKRRIRNIFRRGIVRKNNL